MTDGTPVAPAQTPRSSLNKKLSRTTCEGRIGSELRVIHSEPHFRLDSDLRITWALLRQGCIVLRSVGSVIVVAISMRLLATCQRMIASDTGILVLSALSVVALHTATNGEYGFHRDELATVDDARFLSWGYVVYPPVTPFIARVSLTLFGASMIGLRFFAALAVGIAILLTGLMAREIGGRRAAQLVAAWAAVIAGPALSFGYLSLA